MPRPRLYGLYRRITIITKSGKSRRKYIREYPALAFQIDTARRAFQTALLAGVMQGIVRELRPVSKGYFGQ